MKKSGTTIIAAIVIIIIIAVGAYAIFHKSNKNSSNTTSSTTPVNNAVVVTKTDSKVGQYLADPSGRALYTYNADTKGVSKCTGSCLSNWPAYTAKASSASLPSGVTTIKRSDNGQLQYAYNGLPLYYFTGDSNGQVTGNGVENFSVATPSTSSSSSSSSQSSQPSSSSSSNSNSSSSNNNSSGYSY